MGNAAYKANGPDANIEAAKFLQVSLIFLHSTHPKRRMDHHRQLLFRLGGHAGENHGSMITRVLVARAGHNHTHAGDFEAAKR